MNQLASAVDNVPSADSRAWDYRAVAGAVVYVGLTLAFLLVYGPRWAPFTAGAALLSEVLVRQSSPVLPLVLGASLGRASMRPRTKDCS